MRVGPGADCFNLTETLPQKLAIGFLANESPVAAYGSMIIAIMSFLTLPNNTLSAEQRAHGQPKPVPGAPHDTFSRWFLEPIPHPPTISGVGRLLTDLLSSPCSFYEGSGAWRGVLAPPPSPWL